MNERDRMQYLVERLNEYRDLYYNFNDSPVSDEVYDRLFDELAKLEQKRGVVLANSPTNTVGYTPVGSLKTVKHPTALLSLDKQKDVYEIVKFIGDKKAILMHKLDGLTVRLDYEYGKLVLAATRGDGNEGEDITHNIPAFMNVPLKIPYNRKLSIAGEAFIHRCDFDAINEKLPEEGRYKNVRGLAVGSVRAYDPKICAGRKVCFKAFKVIDGFNELESKAEKIKRLSELGFDICSTTHIPQGTSPEDLKMLIDSYSEIAKNESIPIDGMVVQFDDIKYSQSLGVTGHHPKDGLAFKFEDDRFETVLRDIEWQTSRSGCMAPTAVYDTVEIDGCAMKRATLHNVSFIKKLDLHIGDRILISKRNMIIPAVEENLDAGRGGIILPDKCPKCGAPTEIRTTTINKKTVEKLYCTNKSCGSANIKQFVHFTDKESMNIEGLAEGTITRLIECGVLTEFSDIYKLSEHREEIVNTDGFGEKSYDKLIESVDASKKVPFNRFLRAMDIPLVGRHASKTISEYFSGDINAFENAVFSDTPFDFTKLDGIGIILCQNIYEWFDNEENTAMWHGLKEVMDFEINNAASEKPNNILTGQTVVVTGKVEGYTRSDMDHLIVDLGGIAGDSVTKSTSLLVIAEKPGASKVQKAEKLGLKTMKIDEFMRFVGIAFPIEGTVKEK